MRKCGAKSDRGTSCVLPVGDHYAHFDVDDETWPNAEVQARFATTQGSGLAKARKVARRAVSHSTARDITSPSESSRDKLLQFLMNNKGTWIDATTLLSPALGGPGGLVMIKDLQKEHDISIRRQQDRWQYCLNR